MDVSGRVAERIGWPRIVPGLVAFAVIASVGLADGGLYPRTWRLVTIALLAVAAAGLLARERVVVSRLEWGVLAALAAFTVWTVVAVAWSSPNEAALLEAERALTYVAAVASVLVLAERASLAHLLGGVVAGVTFVCAYGLAVYLFTKPPLDPFEGALLYQPLGYANALGIFAAIGILLSLGLALDAGRPATRLAALAPLAVLAPTLGLTSSRGAWIALAAGLVCLLLLLRHTRAALVTVAAGLTVAVVLAASGAPVSRFAGENRVHYWGVAWKEYEANPLLGGGAGSYVDWWVRERPVPSFTRTAHSLYLETLAELGPLGLVLVTAALALPLAAVARRRDPLLAGAGAGYVAYVLHTGIDWDWELPAPTLAGFFCGAAVLVGARRSGTPLSVRARGVALVPVLGIALVAAIRLGTGGDSAVVP